MAKLLNEALHAEQGLLRIATYHLRCTMDDVCQHQYTCGQRWLQLVSANYPLVIQELESSPCFWRWWRVEWLVRTRHWANMIEKGDDRHAIADQYYWMHNPRMLAGGVNPLSDQLLRSYMALIKAITQKAKKSYA